MAKKDGMNEFISQTMGFLADLKQVIVEIEEIKATTMLKEDSKKEVSRVYNQLDTIVDGLNKQSKKVSERIMKVEDTIVGMVNETSKRSKEEINKARELLEKEIQKTGPLITEIKELMSMDKRDLKREIEGVVEMVGKKIEKGDLKYLEEGMSKVVIDDENISEKTAYSSKKTIEKIDNMINNLRLGGRGKVFIQNEGSDLGQATAINFTGSAVDVTVVNGIHTVDVSGGGGGGTVESVTGTAVDNTDPANPVIDLQDLTGLVPYTGSTGDVNLGANGIILDSLKGTGSGGLALKSSGNNNCLVVGNGGSANATAYGGWNFDGATADTIASFGATKTLTSLATSTYPSLTELSYVKGVTSGIQTQLNALANGMIYKGSWDASVGTFPGSGSADIGRFYTVSVGGTVDSVVFNAEDRLIATADNASTTTYTGNWTKLDATDAVTSVNSQTGNVVLTTAEVADSSNKRYVTDANLTVIGNTSGTNTGDQDLSGLMVKSNNLSDLTNTTTARTNLGLGTLATQSGTFSGTSSGTNTGDQDLSGYALKTGTTFTGDVNVTGADVSLALNTDSTTKQAINIATSKFGIASKFDIAGGYAGYFCSDGTATASASNGVVRIRQATSGASGIALIVDNLGTSKTIDVLQSGTSVFSVNPDGSLEIGHASDTTLSRSSAGVLAVEGVVIPTVSSTNDLTNKNIINTINTQTGTTYTFVLTDGGKLVTFGNAGATTVTVPPNASVAFPTGTQIDCAQLGAGKVTLAQGSGVTINSKSSNKAIGDQYVGVSLIKTDTDTWLLVGDLIA